MLKRLLFVLTVLPLAVVMMLSIFIQLPYEAVVYVFRGSVSGEPWVFTVIEAYTDWASE